MEKLTDMPNIGPVVAKELESVGIDTPEKLRKIGSKQAFIKIKAIDPGACLSKLCGLEGAVQNIRWHNLSEADKKELKEFHSSL